MRSRTKPFGRGHGREERGVGLGATVEVLRLERRPHAGRRIDHHADAPARIRHVAADQRRERIGQREREEGKPARETASAERGEPATPARLRIDASSAGTTSRCRPGRRDSAERTMSSSTISAKHADTAPAALRPDARTADRRDGSCATRRAFWRRTAGSLRATSGPGFRGRRPIAS